MDELLYKMLELDLGINKGGNPSGAVAKGSDSDSDSDDGVVFAEAGSSGKNAKTLVVEQVKIVDAEGGLKVLYPSRTDLNSELIKVIRNFD